MSSRKRIGILRRLLPNSSDNNLTSLLVIFLAGNALVAQQACFLGPCLSPVEPPPADMDDGWDIGEDGDQGVSQDMYIGPCLSPPPPDMEVDMGPCLSADMPIGPCLTPLPPDMGEDMGQEDMNVGPCLSPPIEDMGKEEDMPVGPCLSPPIEDMGAIDNTELQTPRHEKVAPERGDMERQKLLAKLSDRLPADVLAKLGKDLG